MALLTNPVYYRNGTSGASTCIGYESSYNRVLRFSFKTGDKGATSISISVGSGTISKVDGSDQTSIPFYIGTSSSSHKNANEASGSTVTGHITGSSGSAYSGKANVNLKANTTYYLWFFPKSKTYGFSYWHSTGDYSDTTSYSISGTSALKLSITTDNGIKSVVVNRTSSAVGASTGNLSNGATIYKNDKLKITFTAKDNYSITTHTVNDTAFTSGQTHTVSKNVSIKLSTTPLKSTVGATDANIQATSTITITRYNDSYTHTLKCTFGKLTGDIIEGKTKNTSIAWTIPENFYSQLTEANSGVCTITCDTYNGETKIGSSTCKITVTVSQLIRPYVYGTVVDINEITKALTGDASKLIRYKSTAQCEIIYTAYGEASISSVSINGYTPIDNKRTFNNVSNNTFIFKATDSRGNNSSYTATPEIIEYIMLTCNPVITRPSPTEGVLKMSFSGNFFNQSFGKLHNTLTLQYRYKDNEGGTYSDWVKIDDTHISKGTGTYASTNEGNYAPEAFEIEGEFDYTKSYTFQIRAIDGVGENILTIVEKEVNVPQGMPVFDWSNRDFNFNVPVNCKSWIAYKQVDIFDIMYPLGSVYTSVNESIPNVMYMIGSWEKIDSGIDNVYMWKRVQRVPESS